MNDAAPDSASRLTLTLWSRTDTSFTGYLILGAPLHGGGSAYLWHESGVLKMLTVSEAGDTIVWTSRRSDEAIGGQYHIVGGEASGQGGTWRATLAAGSALSPATLRRGRSSVLLPPFDAIWPVLLIMGIVVIGVRWILASPTSTSSPELLPGQTGAVSGWLALFICGQLVTIVIMLAKVGTLLEPFQRGVWDLGSAVAGMHGLLAMEMLTHVVQILAPAIGVYLIVARKRYAPRFWLAYLVFMGAYAVIDIAGGAYLRPQLEALTGPQPSPMPDAGTSPSQTNLRTIMVALLWGLYWSRSAKVRARFGHAALDRPARPLTAAPTPIAG
jgi:hypothetical protein